MSNKIFDTSIINLRMLKRFNFSIPTYQRPYVWKDEQIKKLLDDFYKSFQQDKESDYYAGTILTKENGKKAELVDGQQRFTTLWLIAFAFFRKNTKSSIIQFLKNEDGSLKINFEVRTDIEEYFKNLLAIDGEDDIKKISSNEILKSPYLENIATALTTIQGIIDGIKEEDLRAFGNYIYTKVKVIKNTTPEKINLNKLFSTINSAGVQLEQTDIVKANLLKIVDEKVIFGKIWEACENMNNFFERNIRVSFPKTDWTKIDLSRYLNFRKTIFRFERTNTAEGKSDNAFKIEDLPNLLLEKEEEREDNTQNTNEKRDSEEIYCRSIINFGQLLLHTYRLHLKIEGKADFEGTFHINRLIEIFKPLEERNDTEEIKRFILLLWKVRFLFDKYIIKWISDVDSKTEHLELVNISKNSDGYYGRSKYEKSAMLMLQSILYYTGDYLRQFWLTSYLGYLLANHKDLDANNIEHLNHLERIDNSLSLCKTMTDKEASLILIDSEIDADFDFEKYLILPKGTVFQHYWFYKLEYILWKTLKEKRGNKTNEFLNYRIISRNSIEHIYPQNPENKNKNPKIDDKYLHSWGNLVLLSVSQNSEYSNKSVDEKRSIFKNKNSTYDTLKSYFIFQYDDWKPNDIENHQKAMIAKIKQHYKI